MAIFIWFALQCKTASRKENPSQNLLTHKIVIKNKNKPILLFSTKFTNGLSTSNKDCYHIPKTGQWLFCEIYVKQRNTDFIFALCLPWMAKQHKHHTLKHSKLRNNFDAQKLYGYSNFWSLTIIFPNDTQ